MNKLALAAVAILGFANAAHAGTASTITCILSFGGAPEQYTVPLTGAAGLPAALTRAEMKSRDGTLSVEVDSYEIGGKNEFNLVIQQGGSSIVLNGVVPTSSGMGANLHFKNEPFAAVSCFPDET